MDRLLGTCILLGLAVILALTLCLRSPVVRMYGSELFRSCQRLIVSIQTANWPTIEDRHFIVKYQRGDESSARMVLAEAERVYQPLGSFFGYFPNQKVPILIYPDRASLNRIFGWGNDESAMGVYWAGVIRVLSPKVWMGDIPVSQQQQVFQAQGPVAHEYTHLLVDYKTGGNYTRWLTEGLAQYAEETIAGGDPPDRERLTITAPALEQLDGKFDDPVWQDYSYTVSKDMVSYLISNYGSARIPRMLEVLDRGQPMDKAFVQVYGITLDEFVRSYNAVSPI
jgi:hypothetical protein